MNLRAQDLPVLDSHSDSKIMDSATQRITESRILIVDDEPCNLEVMMGVLTARGYLPYAVPNGRAALSAATFFRPNLILLDINMPGMDGYEVCAALKADAALRKIPVIFLTGLGDTQSLVEAFKIGGADYILKPFHVSEVEVRIETQLRLCHLQQAMERSNSELAKNLKQLSELEALKDGLTSIIVDDLRTPAISAVNHLRLLDQSARGHLGDEEALYLERSINALSTLLEMIRTVLDVEKLENGCLPLHRRRVDLAEVLTAALGTITGVSNDRIVSFKKPPAAVWVYCDAAVVQRMAEHLIELAIKSTRAQDEIVLSCTRSQGAVRLLVSYPGPEIQPNHRDGIFDKFGQVALRKAGRKYSAGLGLAFCKLAAQVHGGEIGVESSPEDGITFWFKLSDCGGPTRESNNAAHK